MPLEATRPAVRNSTSLALHPAELAVDGRELGAQLGTWGLLPMRISEMDPTIQRGRSIL